MDKKILDKAIRNAIKLGDKNEVVNLIEDNPLSLYTCTPFGTWLHVAAAHGKLEIIKYLVEIGIDINIRSGTFCTNALERAATKGHLSIVKYLISKNIVIDTSEPDRNPLFAAIYGGHLDTIKFLVEHVDISIKYSGENMKDIDAYTFAIERGQTEVAEHLKTLLNEKNT